MSLMMNNIRFGHASTPCNATQLDCQSVSTGYALMSPLLRHGGDISNASFTACLKALLNVSQYTLADFFNSL